MQMRDSHGNRSWPHKPKTCPFDVRRVPVDIVWFGDSMSHDGKTLWGAFDKTTDRLICVGPTAPECREKAARILAQEQKERREQKARENDGNPTQTVGNAGKS
jgi:hypothetical protein